MTLSTCLAVASTLTPAVNPTSKLKSRDITDWMQDEQETQEVEFLRFNLHKGRAFDQCFDEHHY